MQGIKLIIRHGMLSKNDELYNYISNHGVQFEQKKLQCRVILEGMTTSTCSGNSWNCFEAINQQVKVLTIIGKRCIGKTTAIPHEAICARMQVCTACLHAQLGHLLRGGRHCSVAWVGQRSALVCLM